MSSIRRCFGCLLAVVSLGLSAGDADVVRVQADCFELEVCSFSVTVRHADTGWTHYADAWEVLAPDGEVLATRVLAHPHIQEQPFTRSLPEVPVPMGVETVIIRAHDSVHGYGGLEARVTLDRPLQDQQLD